ncbi:MAG: S1 family peptidase [Deltaproteobacteria bacterium]|nr:S1 family peptidase [Deltaproteobacteria bacterium]
MNNNLLQLLALTLVAALYGCGGPTASKSNVKVTNGINATGAFPAVVALRVEYGRISGTCTGTFVNASQVVTAAHCVYDLATMDAPASAVKFVREKADGTAEEVDATGFVHHPDFVNNPAVLNNHDIAVITFPADAAPGVVSFHTKRPIVGQQFTIVGYGLNDYDRDRYGNQVGSGGGIKRMGTNKIERIKNGMIEFTGVPTASDLEVPQGEHVASGSGDSGGPMLIDGKLVATTSGGGLVSLPKDGKFRTVKASSYVDLTLPTNHDFLKESLTSAAGW